MSLKVRPAHLPTAGTKLLLAGNATTGEVGYVTSTGISLLLHGPIGLGYVRREHETPGTHLDASGTEAEVISPPGSE